MNPVVEFILLLLGAICFIASAFGYSGPPNPSRPWNLLALGLFFWILVPLIHAGQALG